MRRGAEHCFRPDQRAIPGALRLVSISTAGGVAKQPAANRSSDRSISCLRVVASTFRSRCSRHRGAVCARCGGEGADPVVPGGVCSARPVRVRHRLRTGRLVVARSAQADAGNAARSRAERHPHHSHRLFVLLRPDPARHGRGDHSVVHRPAPDPAARPPVSRREDARASGVGRVRGLRRRLADRPGRTEL